MSTADPSPLMTALDAFAQRVWSDGERSFEDALVEAVDDWVAISCTEWMGGGEVLVDPAEEALLGALSRLLDQVRSDAAGVADVSSALTEALEDWSTPRD